MKTFFMRSLLCFIFGFSFEEFILVNDFDPFGTFA